MSKKENVVQLIKADLKERYNRHHQDVEQLIKANEIAVQEHQHNSTSVNQEVLYLIQEETNAIIVKMNSIRLKLGLEVV